MAFTVTLHTVGPVPPPDDLARWLTEQGEPFEVEGLQTLALRALPVRLVVDEDGSRIQAQVGVTASLPLMRLVDLLFDLSVLAGADVRLAGQGAVTRPALWLRMADEQDRLRISEALKRADDHGNRDEVIRRLWAVLAILRPGRDVRWSHDRRAIVELMEVGGEGGLTVDEAAWLDPNASLGDLVAVPVDAYLHSLAWRWLSEAYPGLVA